MRQQTIGKKRLAPTGRRGREDRAPGNRLRGRGTWDFKGPAWTGYADRLRQEFGLHAGAVTYIANALRDAGEKRFLHKRNLARKCVDLVYAKPRRSRGRAALLKALVVLENARDPHDRLSWPELVSDLKSILYEAAAVPPRPLGRPGERSWVEPTVRDIAAVLKGDVDRRPHVFAARGKIRLVSVAIYDGLKLVGLAGNGHAIATSETVRNILREKRAERTRDHAGNLEAALRDREAEIRQLQEELSQREAEIARLPARLAAVERAFLRARLRARRQERDQLRKGLEWRNEWPKIFASLRGDSTDDPPAPLRARRRRKK